MILSELLGDEESVPYQNLEISNNNRQYDFLRSAVDASIASNATFLSQQVIKALNFHAIACLHTNAGEYRPCEVEVGDYKPPQHFRVQALMDDFVNRVNRYWDTTDSVVLSAFVLWKLNQVHPFINGNGRTARVASYFVLCLKSGGWLQGSPILPELIRRERHRYVEALQTVDATVVAGSLDLTSLHALLVELLAEQMENVGTPSQ